MGRDVCRLVLHKTLLEDGPLSQGHILASQSIQDLRILHTLTYQLVQEKDEFDIPHQEFGIDWAQRARARGLFPFRPTSLARLRELIHSRTDRVHDDESRFASGSGGQSERTLLEVEETIRGRVCSCTMSANS